MKKEKRLRAQSTGRISALRCFKFFWRTIFKFSTEFLLEKFMPQSLGLGGGLSGYIRTQNTDAGKYLVGNNNMRRRRMGEMQTKFHQKTYICLLLLVFNRWQSDFFFHLYIYTFLLSFLQKFNWLQNTIYVQSWFTRL